MSKEKDAPKQTRRNGTLSEVPKFDFIQEIFKAVRYAKSGWPTVNRATGSYKDMEARQKIDSLVPVIKKFGEITSNELASHLGESENVTHKRLRKLLAEGILERGKQRPYKYWVKK